jgi:hypothetical protein
MNEIVPKDFEEHLIRVIDSIAAGAGRKRMMREELLEHLLECYQVELGARQDERAAILAAIERMGNVDELQLQLQGSVPFFERVLFLCLSRKETFMLRWLWAVGVVAWVIGSQFSFPHNEQVEFAGIAIFFGYSFWHLRQKNNIASRLVGPRWPWLMGFIVVMFGVAVVLPAMAKIKNEGGFGSLSVEYLALGVLITLGGIGVLFFGNKNLRRHSA